MSQAVPVHTTNPDPLYLIGRLAALAEKGRGRPLPTSVVNVLTVTPLKGLGLLGPYLARVRKDGEIVDVMDALPPSVPKGPLSIEAQAPYWLGYQHQRALRDARASQPADGQ